MYGFLRQPRWIAAHILVVLLLTTFAGAGAWQYTRHTARQDENTLIDARRDLTPLTGADLGKIRPDDDEFRTVEIRGAWSAADAVLVRNRSQAGASGCHLAAPLDTGAELSLLVVLGWLPDGDCVAGDIPVEFPDGSVSILGRLRATQTRGSLGPRDAADGRLTTLARTDVSRIDQQVALDLAPMYAELIEATPSMSGLLVLEAPVTDSGPHFAYAVQWFLFFGVGAIGYPLVLRHQARRGDLDVVADPPS